VYDNETLENLKPLLTVTATYSDGTTKSVSGYTLSGTLSEGVSTIMISYTENGITKTDTFTVTVTHYEAPSTGLYATYDGATMYDYDAPNDIRSHLTVTLDGNAVEPSAYYITGPMVGGTTNTLSISYNGETTTISVDVVDQIISQQKLPMRTLPAGYTQLDYIYPDVSDETPCFIQLSGLRSRQVSYAKYGI
jgi:hypothetical protein